MTGASSRTRRCSSAGVDNQKALSDGYGSKMLYTKLGLSTQKENHRTKSVVSKQSEIFANIQKKKTNSNKFLYKVNVLYRSV